MTDLERLLKADSAQGGTIHEYARKFAPYTSHIFGGPVDLGAKGFGDLARSLMEQGEYDLARLASRASIAHMTLSKR